MHREAHHLDRLHSVRFRSRGYSAKKLIGPEREMDFLQFLSRALGEDVFVISTGLGLDVYYLSHLNHTRFISRHLWLFRPKETRTNDFFIAEERQGHEVFAFFDAAVDDLAGHPHLFLSVCKKLIAQFNALGLQNLLNPLLYTCFDNGLNRLSDDDRVPFARKINALRNERQIDLNLSSDVLKKLAQQFKNPGSAN